MLTFYMEYTELNSKIRVFWRESSLKTNMFYVAIMFSSHIKAPITLQIKTTQIS